MGARNKEKNVVFLYRGPGREIPWHEMLRAIKEHAGKDAILSLTMNCEVVHRDLAAQIDRARPAPLDEPIPPPAGMGDESEKRTTIYDVAREAKVSHTTVSRVANDRLCVSPALRARVEEVMARLNYKPSDVARAMVKTRDEKRHTLKDGANGTAPPKVSGDKSAAGSGALVGGHQKAM